MDAHSGNSPEANANACPKSARLRADFSRPCAHARTPLTNQGGYIALFEILSSPVFHGGQKIALFVTVYLSESEHFILHKILLLDGGSHFLIIAMQKFFLRDGTVVNKMFDLISFHNWILRFSDTSRFVLFCRLALSFLPFQAQRDIVLPLHRRHAKAFLLRRW